MQMYNYPSQFEYVSGQTPWTHWTYPTIIGAVYMTTILGLRAIMKNVPNRIEARLLAAVHNFNMFALSVVCFFGIGYGTVKLGWVRIGAFGNTSICTRRCAVWCLSCPLSPCLSPFCIRSKFLLAYQLLPMLFNTCAELRLKRRGLTLIVFLCLELPRVRRMLALCARFTG